MKVIKQSITAANLNTGNPQKLTIETTDEHGVIIMPNEIVVVNSTGASLGIVYISDDVEDALFASTPTYFDYLPLSAGKSNATLPSRIKYVYVKELSGSATADLDLYFVGYMGIL